LCLALEAIALGAFYLLSAVQPLFLRSLPLCLRRLLSRCGGIGDRRNLASLQSLHLDRRERAKFSRFDVELERTVAHALDLLDVVPDLLEHAMDLPVASLGEGDLVPRIGRVFNQLDSRGRGAHLADASLVLLVDGDAGAQAPKGFLRGLPADLHQVRFGHVERCMREPLGEVAVVGQQQQSLGVVVEPSDREHARADAGNQVHDGGTSFGVGNRADVAARLVQHEIDPGFGAVQQLAAHPNMVDGGIGAGAQFGDGLAVDGDKPAGNQLFGLAARSNSGGGDDLLEAFGRHISIVVAERSPEWRATPNKSIQFRMAGNPITPIDAPRAYGFDLDAEIRALMQAPTNKGRSTRMLVSFPQLRVLLVRMEKASRWDEHIAPGRITIQTLSGHVRLLANGESYDAPPRRLIALGTGIPHDVEAVEPSVFLLTVDRDEPSKK
jgi:quercetin dioxygenase-like cupin family protein